MLNLGKNKNLILIFVRYSYLNNRRRNYRDYRQRLHRMYRRFDTFYRRRSTGLKVTVGCSFALLAGCCFTGSDSVLQRFQLDYVEVLLMRCFLQMLTNSLWITFKNYSFWPAGTTFKAKVYMMTNVSFHLFCNLSKSLKTFFRRRYFLPYVWSVFIHRYY